MIIYLQIIYVLYCIVTKPIIKVKFINMTKFLFFFKKRLKSLIIEGCIKMLHYKTVEKWSKRTLLQLFIFEDKDKDQNNRVWNGFLIRFYIFL